MTKEEFEFVLAERKQKIIVMDSQWDLEHKAYLSLSGGKDSMVVHKLLDMALPGNQIPRVFVNTGIEFKAVSKYVQQLAAEDPRIVMLRPTQDIQAMLREKGWPFKSKDHSERVSNYQHTGRLSPSTIKYIERERASPARTISDTSSRRSARFLSAASAAWSSRKSLARSGCVRTAGPYL